MKPRFVPWLAANLLKALTGSHFSGFGRAMTATGQHCPMRCDALRRAGGRAWYSYYRFYFSAGAETA